MAGAEGFGFEVLDVGAGAVGVVDGVAAASEHDDGGVGGVGMGARAILQALQELLNL